MSLLKAPPIYKPFKYPWAYDAWLQQQRIHWLPEEVPLADDVSDWNRKLTKQEKNLLLSLFYVQVMASLHRCSISCLLHVSAKLASPAMKKRSSQQNISSRYQKI